MAERLKILVVCPNYEERLSLAVHECHMYAAVQWLTHHDVAWHYPRRIGVAKARTGAAQQALKLGFTHVLWIDDDVLFDVGILEVLTAAIQREDVDVVGLPYLFRSEDTTTVPVFARAPLEEYEYGLRPFGPDDFGKGLVEVAGLAMGCCLTPLSVFTESRTDVVPIDQEEMAWFYTPPLTGTEDMIFFKRIAERGFRVWCHTDYLVDHLWTAPKAVDRPEALKLLPGKPGSFPMATET